MSIQRLPLRFRIGLRRRPGTLGSAWKQPLAITGLALAGAWILIVIFVPLIAPYDPLAQSAQLFLAPGSPHVFGTDELGRDLFSRVLWGARLSLPLAFFLVAMAVAIGGVLGGLAGYFGGWVDEIVMRATDLVFAFPTIILAMAIAAALGPNVTNAIITIAIVSWPNYARVTRGLVLGVKYNEYVEAARAAGAHDFYILTRTILPNCVGPLIVLATLDLGNAILIFAGLSFLGLGPAPETPEWGRMVADGIDYADQWWVSAFPGFAIFSVVMALNFVGDGLRDALDPRSGLR